jgi:hypothetical protein
MSYWDPRRSWCAFTMLALAAASLALSCGETDRPPPPSDGGGGRDSDDGEGGEGPTGSGGEGGTAGVPGAPSVEVRAPEDADVLADTLEATCAVLSDDAPGASPVNPSSVVVQLLDQDGEVVVEGPAAVAGADEFTVAFPLADVPSGRYTVTCSGSDSALPPLTGIAEVSVLIDHGPAIEAINPLANGYLARAGLHDFEVKIRPVPLFPDDDDAELVGDPILTVDHQEFTLVPKDGEADVFIVEGIDFEDEELFPEPPPDQTAVVVTAENGRAVSGRLDYNVAVDGTGPAITIASPTPATIIGNRVTFVFDITDDFSGVDWDSLVVVAKDIPIPFDAASSRWAQSGNTATLEINTSDYSAATQMAINVTVADIAGNVSSNGADATYFLDQQPPMLALDPPNVRLIDKTPATADLCSYAFDAVGAGAVNHGDSTPNLVQFRALAWDVTNEEEGQTIFYYSAVDTTSIRLWLAPADGDTLLLDDPLDDGNICDSIAIDDNVSTVQLNPITVGGLAHFSDEPGDLLPGPDMTGICQYNVNTAPPAHLCGDVSDLSYAVGQMLGGNSYPAVYAPLVGAGVLCTGGQQSVAALLGDYEGWVCAAVSGEDRAGNVAVSAPIAFCMDNPTTEDSPTCVGEGAIAAPDCTGTCIPGAFPAEGLIINPNSGG